MKLCLSHALAAVVSMTVFPASASAIYDFSYQFKEGYNHDRQYHEAMLFSGSFSGTEKGNLVQIQDDIQLYVNGTHIFENVTFSASHFLIPELTWKPGDAVASYDGAANNFLFYYEDQYGYQRGVFQSIPQGFRGEIRWTSASGYLPAYHSEFVPSSDVGAQWSLTRRIATNEVPEPVSLALFGLGTVIAAGARRRRTTGTNS